MTRPDTIHNGKTRRTYNAMTPADQAFARVRFAITSTRVRREFDAWARADRAPGIYPTPEEAARRREIAFAEWRN